MAQLSYSVNMAIGAEGAIAEGAIPNRKVSGRAASAIPPGRGVFAAATGEDPPLVALTNATGKVTGLDFVGFSILDSTAESSDGTNGAFAANDILAILKQGEIWLRSETAVAAAYTQVFVRFTAGAGDLTIGRVRTDVDGTNAVALPGAIFLDTCAAGALVKVRYTARQ